MFHQKIHRHVKKHGHKYLAVTVLAALFALVFAYRPSAWQTTWAAGYQQWTSNVLVNAYPDGNFNTRQRVPVVERTTDGNYIAVWQEGSVGSEYDIYAQKFNSSGDLLWDTGWGDMPIATLSGEEPYYDLVDLESDGNTGSFIAYGHKNPVGPYYDVYVKRIDGTDGSEVCSAKLTAATDSAEQFVQIYPDGSGGVYAAWVENIGYDVYLTHLTSTCTTAAGWNTGGSGTYRPLTVYPGTTTLFYLNLMSGGSGNLIATFYDNTVTDDLRAVKVADDGSSIVWTSPAITDTAEYAAVPDGSGGVIFGYNNNNQNKISMLRLKSADGTVDSTGNWAGSPIVLSDNTPNMVYDIQGVSNTTAGTTDGGIFLWTETDWDINTRLYAQKVLADGTKSWNSGNKLEAVNTDASVNTWGDWNNSVSDNAGGIYLAYLKNAFMGGDLIVGNQHILSNGTLDYGNAGLDFSMMSPSYYQYPSLAFNGSNGIMTVFLDNDAANGGNNIYAQYVTDTYPAPSISAVSPNFSYINATNVNVIIEGSGMANVETATVGGAACSLIQRADSFYECQIATVPNTPGLADVYVVSPSGNSGTTGNDLFTIYGSPSFTNMNPASGPASGGTDITFTGSGFGPETRVMFGLQEVTPYASSTTQLSLYSPSGAVGTAVDVTITNPGSLTASAGQFTYEALPGEWDNNIIARYPAGDATYEYNHQIIRTSDGNFMAAWIDTRSSEITNIYARKIDAATNTTFAGWPDEGLAVTNLSANIWNGFQMTSDGAGGAYFVYDYQGPADDYTFVYAQRVFSNGTLWRENGKNMVGFGEYGTLANSGSEAGGVYIAWKAIDASFQHDGFRVARLNAATSSDEFPPVTIAGDGGYIKIATDSNNNLFAFHLNSLSTTINTGEISPAGTFTAGNAIQAGIEDENMQSIYQISAIPDGANGVIVLYNGMDVLDAQQLVTRRFLPDRTWDQDWRELTLNGVGGIQLASVFTDYDQFVTDGAGGAFFAWSYSDGGRPPTMYIRGQYINEAGEKVWGAPDILMASDSLSDGTNSSIVSSGDGGFIISTNADRLQKFRNNAGAAEAMWPLGSPTAGGYDLNIYSMGVDSIVLASNNTGGAAAIWAGLTPGETPDIFGQYFTGTDGGGGGCLPGDPNQVCGWVSLECPTTSTVFSVMPNNFQMAEGGNRYIRNINDTAYVTVSNSGYFEENAPGVFTDETDTLTINSNVPQPCGAPANAVSLSVSATPFMTVGGAYMLTYGADQLLDDPAYSNDDYTAMFSVITSGPMTCSGNCTLAAGSVESLNEQKNGQNNYFAGETGKTPNAVGFDTNALLIGNNNTPNTVTLYQASQGFSGDLTVPGLDYNLALPSDLTSTGSYTSTVTYTLS